MKHTHTHTHTHTHIYTHTRTYTHTHTHIHTHIHTYRHIYTHALKFSDGKKDRGGGSLNFQTVKKTPGSLNAGRENWVKLDISQSSFLKTLQIFDFG